MAVHFTHFGGNEICVQNFSRKPGERRRWKVGSFQNEHQIERVLRRVPDLSGSE